MFNRMNQTQIKMPKQNTMQSNSIEKVGLPVVKNILNKDLNQTMDINPSKEQQKLLITVESLNQSEVGTKDFKAF